MSGIAKQVDTLASTSIARLTPHTSVVPTAAQPARRTVELLRPTGTTPLRNAACTNTMTIQRTTWSRQTPQALARTAPTARASNRRTFTRAPPTVHARPRHVTFAARRRIDSARFAQRRQGSTHALHHPLGKHIRPRAPRRTLTARRTRAHQRHHPRERRRLERAHERPARITAAHALRLTATDREQHRPHRSQRERTRRHARQRRSTEAATQDLHRLPDPALISHFAIQLERCHQGQLHAQGDQRHVE